MHYIYCTARKKSDMFHCIYQKPMAGTRIEINPWIISNPTDSGDLRLARSDAPPLVRTGLVVGLIAVDCTDAKKLSQAAIVADGYTIVEVAVPDPNKISDWPGRISPTRCGSFSPPATETDPEEFVTSPVWLDPKINSLKKTKACVCNVWDRRRRTEDGGGREKVGFHARPTVYRVSEVWTTYGAREKRRNVRLPERTQALRALRD